MPFTANPDDEHLTLSEALRDVMRERRRQIHEEGMTPEKDDAYQDGELPLAAACYALWSALASRGEQSKARAQDLVRRWWPWAFSWWKPSTRRRDLVKAAALILADIERLDRAAQKEGS